MIFFPEMQNRPHILNCFNITEYSQFVIFRKTIPFLMTDSDIKRQIVVCRLSLRWKWPDSAPILPSYPVYLTRSSIFWTRSTPTCIKVLVWVGQFVVILIHCICDTCTPNKPANQRMAVECLANFNSSNKVILLFIFLYDSRYRAYR